MYISRNQCIITKRFTIHHYHHWCRYARMCNDAKYMFKNVFLSSHVCTRYTYTCVQYVKSRIYIHTQYMFKLHVYECVCVYVCMSAAFATCEIECQSVKRLVLLFFSSSSFLIIVYPLSSSMIIIFKTPSTFVTHVSRILDSAYARRQSSSLLTRVIPSRSRRINICILGSDGTRRRASHSALLPIFIIINLQLLIIIPDGAPFPM